MSFEAPGIDPVVVRLTLAALAEQYGARIVHTNSPAERANYLEAWARTARRELEGLDTAEAANLRALYDAILERVQA